MHDKFRKKFRTPPAKDRLRGQIALEAARRLYDAHASGEEMADVDWLNSVTENDYYVAKRKAAAVLGHRIRPGDLPTDLDVRGQVVKLWRSKTGQEDDEAEDAMPEPEEDEPAVPALAEKLDRFTVYRLRLIPLEAVKQNPKTHPEGDALYHSLQVFHLAREARPYDEEFLLAALLHDVGKAIDPREHAAAGVHALVGSVTDRTLWLIAHHMDLASTGDRPTPSRIRREDEPEEWLDDLKLLHELNDAGRVPGAAVDSLDDVLDYLQGLEREDYLND